MRTHTRPPNGEHSPSKVIPDIPRSILEPLKWICSREGTEDQQCLAGSAKWIEKVEGSVSQVDQNTGDRASSQRECVEGITNYFCRRPGEDHGRVKRVMTRLGTGYVKLATGTR